MSFNALVLQLLISAPSDLPDDHKDAVLRAVRLWNNTQSRFYSIHFSTTDWYEGGTPAFGEYAQDVLNDQIVDESDLGVVIFTDRLGSPTPEHPSGTAEEIVRLRDNGKEVAVLVNNSARTPPSGKTALDQRAALEDYLSELRGQAFIADYDTPQRLVEVVNGLLTRIAIKYRREADAALTDDSPTPDPAHVASPVLTTPGLLESEADPSRGVWPRVEVSESSESDSKGHIKVKRRWSVVLESNMDQPVTNVSYRYERSDGSDEEDFDLLGSRAEPIEILPPHGSQSFPLMQSMASPSSAMCVVTWTDPAGVERTTRASVRTH